MTFRLWRCFYNTLIYQPTTTIHKWWYVWKQKVRNSVGFCWLVLCHFALFGQTCLFDLVGTFFALVCSHIVMANAPLTLPTIFGSFSHYFSIWMNASTFYLKDKSTKGHRGWLRLDHTPKPLMDRNHASSLLVIGRRKNYQGSVSGICCLSSLNSCWSSEDNYQQNRGVLAIHKPT